MRQIQLKKTIAIAFMMIFTMGSFWTFFSISPDVVDLNEVGSVELPKIPTENLELSSITQIDSKFSVGEWWNAEWRYRIGFNIENPNSFDRYSPVTVLLRFNENEYYIGTERLVPYNVTGDESWSTPIPVQVWNETLCADTSYISSCTITFLANVSSLSNQTYFFYYNENGDTIDTNYDYNTGFGSTLAGGKLDVTVAGNSSSDYSVALQEGYASNELIKTGLDFHKDGSLAPEKQLTHPSLKFLAHLDEGTGTTVSDSTGNCVDGTFQGTSLPTWTSNGRVGNAVNLSGTLNERISFPSELEDVGDPFDTGSTAITLTCWINPSSITSSASNHQTQNCFAAKASDSYNDNFEIGLNAEGNIHVYLDTTSGNTYTDFGPTNTITTTGGWYFIAFRYQGSTGTVNVFIGDENGVGDWYSASNWGSGSLRQAENSEWTIGATDHSAVRFTGAIDEFAVYNQYLSDTEVENYKYCSSPSTIDLITEIENGQVFSSFQIDWTDAFDMHITDTITFYYDLNIWNTNRSIYFENSFDGDDPNNLAGMAVLNTYYDISGFNDHDECYYFADGNVDKDIRNPDLDPADYAIVFNAPDSSKDAFGILIPNYTLSDPLHSSISFLNGTISYSSNEVTYNPGSITDFENGIGNDTKKLIVDYWEYIDAFNTTGYYDSDLKINTYFNNLIESLQTPFNQYIYEDDAFFYNIFVNVTDHDGNSIPDATVIITNSSNPTQTWNQNTEEDGTTTFQRMGNGTFLIGVNYTNFGRTINITDGQIVDVQEGTVSVSGVKEVNFFDCQMTSLYMRLDRYNSTLDYQDIMSGAKINFTIDGEVFSSYISSNSTGWAVLRWANLTASDNITFSIEWSGYWQTDINTTDNLLGASNPTLISLRFTDIQTKVINVTQGRTFETFLVLNDTGALDKMLGDELYYWVNYSLVENGTEYSPMTVATIEYEISIGAVKQHSGNLIFDTYNGSGIYSMRIDTNGTIEAGGSYWQADNVVEEYQLKITATQPGYESQILFTTIALDPKSTTMTFNQSTSFAFWNEYITFQIYYYESISGQSPMYLTGATVEYFVGNDAPGVAGSFSELGNGYYEARILSTDFPQYGDYDLQVSASLDNYENQNEDDYSITINPIRTLLNGSSQSKQRKSLNIYIGDIQFFYFNYTIASDGTGLVGADTSEGYWELDGTGGAVAGYNLNIQNTVEGIYVLDFDTETLGLGTYFVDVYFESINYAKREFDLTLNIIEREFDTTAISIYSVVSGSNLDIAIKITDLSTGQVINDTSEAYIIFSGVRHDFVYNSITENWEISITNIPGDVFIMPQVFSIDIYISRTNYSTTTIPITINVEMLEIFPGMPMFWFLVIIGAIAAVVGSLVLNRVVQQSKIPTFVKKTTAMRKAIDGNAKISDSLVYPLKVDATAKLLGDRWESIGLSLDDVLGVQGKKGKIAPKDSIKKKGGDV